MRVGKGKYFLNYLSLEIYDCGISITSDAKELLI